MKENKLLDRVSSRYVSGRRRTARAARPGAASRRRRRLLALAVVATVALAAALVLCVDEAKVRAETAWDTLSGELAAVWSRIPMGIGRLDRVNEGAAMASGIIQAQEIALASEYGGRIDTISVRKGDLVTTGEVLVHLDTALLDAEIEAARAAVDLAEATLARARAGARPGQIAIAAAQLAQADASSQAARQAITDTQALVVNPQHIRLQIAVTQADVQAAKYRIAQALALKDAAEIGKDKFAQVQRAVREAGGEGTRRAKVKVASGSIDQLLENIPEEWRKELPEVPEGTFVWRDYELHVKDGQYELYKWVSVNVNVPFEMHLMPNTWWQAWVGVNAAAATEEGLEASLAQLYAQVLNPQHLKADADQAVAALARSEALAAAARARLQGLKAGASKEEIDALEARVAQARAARDSLVSRRDSMRIVSPMKGVVVDLASHVGEEAAPGATLLTLADVTRMWLTVYLPQTQIGRIRLGQVAHVTVDSFPDRTFVGQVTHIADHAEFTPRNVSTKEERTNLVFAVEIAMDSHEGALKAGMPADVVLTE